MEIKINNVSLNVDVTPYPFWFRIKQGDNEISFTHEEAPAIADALNNLIDYQQMRCK